MTIKTRNHEAAICASPVGDATRTQQRFRRADAYANAIANCAELAALVDRHTDGKGNGIYATAIDSL